MKKILIVTPMMPPTPGGPSTHAKKLLGFFGSSLGYPSESHSLEFIASLVNFEKYKKFPSGVRHFLVFVEVFFKSFNKKVILALDGFTVALPSVIVGKLLRKKVILRVGGDFIYEQFLYKKETDLDSFYKNFEENKKIMSKVLYFKYLVEKIILENSYGIIFNTEWQKNIFAKHFNLNDKKIFVIENPVERIDENIYKFAGVSVDFANAQKEKKLIFSSITRDIPYKNLNRLKNVFSELGGNFYLETTQGSWESCLKRISLSRACICASLSDISPNQVQEAISLGVPVIISKYTGITEYLVKSGVARVVDPFSEEDIKKAILEMSDDIEYAKYTEAIKNFSWPQNWQSLFTQYNKIINEIVME